MVNKNKKIIVGVLFGGPSAEHDVSVVSATEVIKHLDKKLYTVVPIKISKNGLWPARYPLKNLKKQIDVAFIVMHGSFGEDGIVQALLEAHGVPYTGSGILPSALAMDKWRSGLLAQQIGLTVPFSVLVSSSIDIASFAQKIVLKPNTGGSSIGVEIVSKAQLKKRVSALAVGTAPTLIAQDYIPGRELTVSVLGNTAPSALPVIEIIPKAKLYDYKSKYDINGSKHIIPANIPRALSNTIQSAAMQIHIALGCNGASRSDFILDDSNTFWYLETNTIPGMTPTSLLPQAANEKGMSFSMLLDYLIATAQ